MAVRMVAGKCGVESEESPSIIVGSGVSLRLKSDFLKFSVDFVGSLFTNSFYTLLMS